MNHQLSGKVAIVTGASSGIGRATSRALARCGTRVALASRSSDRLKELERELGENALAVPTDVTDGSEVARLVSRTRDRFGPVDILFANAGIYLPGLVASGDPEAWARLLDVNVNGVLRCIHAVLPEMIARRCGDILVTSSISGFIDIEWEPVYSASKHAVQGFVHTLRRQVAPHGVRVGSIAPGKVANELWGFGDEDAIAKEVAAHTSLRSEDVAELVLVMLSQPPHVTIRDLVVLPQSQDL